MGWIILEGLDRSGKSSVAELYASKGYESFHFDTPDKKYFDLDYVGPSYLDECVDLYMSLSGRDVVFDRSIYGETVWPEVYGRKSQLSHEDVEVLQEIEDANDCQRILMEDPNFEAHWQRCVTNKEPLTRAQFNKGVAYYDRLSGMHSFKKYQLSDFEEGLKQLEGIPKKGTKTEVAAKVTAKAEIAKNVTEQQRKLEQANAINSILTAKIIKKKGPIFENIEKDVRNFLQERLSIILGTNIKTKSFSEEEIYILKTYAQRIKERSNGKK